MAPEPVSQKSFTTRSAARQIPSRYAAAVPAEVKRQNVGKIDPDRGRDERYTDRRDRPAAAVAPVRRLRRNAPTSRR